MDSTQMARFQQAKEFIQKFLSSVTDLSLPHLKTYFKSLEKDLANKQSQQSTLSQYSSVTEIINNTIEAKGKAALHFACARGDVQIVKFLVEEYKADIHIKDSEKNTPFLTAVQHDHLSVIRYFVEELGYAVNTSTDGNITAMHIAANNNACDIIEYLISKGTDLSDVGGDIERVSIYGKPINWAVGANRSQASLLLLERGADPNGDTSGPFPAPIILALDFGNTQIYERLIQKGANLDIKDPKGYSLLHLAAEKGDLQMVKFLIGKGLDPNYAAEGKTSYFLAFLNQKFEVVEYLKSIINKDNYEAVERLVLDLKKKTSESHLSKQEIEVKSNQFKSQGNTFYAQKKYEEAIEQYTKAIEVDPSNNILYSNRAAAYLALKNYQKTLQDCQMAKKINPNHIKTVVREAQAYLGLSNYLEAAVSFWEALKQEPHNQEIFAEFNKCKQLAQEQHQNNS